MFRVAVLALALVTLSLGQPAPAQSPEEKAGIKACKKLKGFYTSRAKNDFCCDRQCGQCGGKGCGQAPGGSRNCCPSPIINAGEYCNEDVFRAPCILRKVVPTAKPTKMTLSRCAPSKMDWDCCSWFAPCQAGEGDCDSDLDCDPAGNLKCMTNAGSAYGVDSTFDVCEVVGTPSAPKVPTNPTGTCDPRYNNWDCCKNQPNGCSAGMGDCDNDGECASGLVCADDVGAKYGADAYMDVCEAPMAGGASPRAPCPTRMAGSYTSIASNTTATCLSFGASLCNMRYVKVSMTGQDVGVPCAWESNMGMCLPRLDCVHSDTATQLVPTPKPTQATVANDVCPILSNEVDCILFNCNWSPEVGKCSLVGNEPRIPDGIKACPALKTEASCTQWTKDLGCGWNADRDSCIWTECTELKLTGAKDEEHLCDSVTRCRSDPTLGTCVDKSTECFVDMNGLIAAGTSVSDAKSICILGQLGCRFTQHNGGWKCVPEACEDLNESECAAVPWRCVGNGKRGKKFECNEGKM